MNFVSLDRFSISEAPSSLEVKVMAYSAGHLDTSGYVGLKRHSPTHIPQLHTGRSVGGQLDHRRIHNT